MDSFELTSAALQEPWRLWTGHLAHFGWPHFLANALALLVPWMAASPGDRRRIPGMLLLLAPLLSLLLLPTLGEQSYRGASGLACALWAMIGLSLSARREPAWAGGMLLAGLGLKLVLESAFGTSFLRPAVGWQPLPEAHEWGAALGLLAGFHLIHQAPGPASMEPEQHSKGVHWRFGAPHVPRHRRQDLP